MSRAHLDPVGALRRCSAHAALVGLLAASVACAPAMTGYEPLHVGPHELTLRYEKGVQIHSGREHLTSGPVYRGLAEHVRCVPLAYEHARYATKHGRARRGLAWSGGAMGAASLGGLSGFAFLDEEPKTAFALLGAGLGVAVLGIVLAGASRSAGNRAHGNAIDAINYYNDAVGSVGGSCSEQAEAPSAPPLALMPAPGGVARGSLTLGADGADRGERPVEGPQPHPESSSAGASRGAGQVSAPATAEPSQPGPHLGAFSRNGGL